ncbi:hypothetical protein ACFSKL_03200 [Belliella marina]|uniref:Lipoprotein n=1 Tax=Belliella marina TaxID=1644146 RepID=A0ABW4VI86_9BACT
MKITMIKGTVLKLILSYCILFIFGCVNENGPEECVLHEIESDSFWVYDNECLKNAELGLNDEGFRKITSNEQYLIFRDCLPDNPEIDFDSYYLMVAKVLPGNYFPYVQEIRLLEDCDGLPKIEIEVVETPFLEVNVSKYSFVILSIEIPEPKIETIWF